MFLPSIAKRQSIIVLPYNLLIHLGLIYSAHIKRPWKGKGDLKLRLESFNMTTRETVRLKGMMITDLWINCCAAKGRLFKIDSNTCEIYTPANNR